MHLKVSTAPKAGDAQTTQDTAQNHLRRLHMQLYVSTTRKMVVKEIRKQPKATTLPPRRGANTVGIH